VPCSPATVQTRLLYVLLRLAREHLRDNCPEKKMQRKILWADVRQGPGRCKDRFKIRDLFADERCSRAILDFLATTGMGRRAPDRVEEE